MAGPALAGAIALVVPWEGRESTAITTPTGTLYVAYQDIAGVWTACDGMVQGVKKGDRYTSEQCDASLALELQQANDYINQCITTPISDKERSAYVSAGYNLGPDVMCSSALQRLLNAGDHRGACMQLTRWVHVKDKFVQGLLNRRKAEQRVCLQGVDKKA